MMLPDGVQKRSSDWTLFFLNRKSQIEGMVARSPFNLRLFQFSHPKKNEKLQKNKKDKGSKGKKTKKYEAVRQLKIESIQAYLFKFEMEKPEGEGESKGGPALFSHPLHFVF